MSTIRRRRARGDDGEHSGRQCEHDGRPIVSQSEQESPLSASTSPDECERLHLSWRSDALSGREGSLNDVDVLHQRLDMHGAWLRAALPGDYTDKAGVVHSEILLPEGAPERWRDCETLWNARVPAEVAREERLRRGLSAYAEAWADASRMRVAGLPVLAHQTEAMARAGQALDGAGAQPGA